jgi:hypothetical protein
MASFTLGTAAQATGTAKSTILRAIRSGRISAQRDDLGQWVIDPAELGRVFPLLAVPGAPPPEPRTELDATTDVLVAELRATIADLRSDRDHWRDAHERGQAALAEALAAHTATQQLLAPPDATPLEQDATLAAPPEGAKRQTFWQWLFESRVA